MKIIISIIIGLILHFSGYAQEKNQCQIKFEHSVSKVESSDLFEISLLMTNGNGRFEVKLFDIKNNRMLSSYLFKSQDGLTQTVFKNLNKGTYLIGINQGECRQTIGGINGFKVE
jgi:hypothetical protein